MYGAFGSASNIRAIAIGCAALSVACAVTITRPKALPLPHLSFAIGSASVADAATTITLTRVDADAASALVTSIDDVNSQASLVAYADALMRFDSHISSVTLGDHAVSMSYETTNTILNVKSVSDLTQASVADDGSVTLSGSWYRPLFSHTIQASSPDAGFSDIIMAHTASALSPALQARILSRLHGRFQIGALR